jgi:acetoin utilization deacetylase AcuC-like enzyme
VVAHEHGRSLNVPDAVQAGDAEFRAAALHVLDDLVGAAGPDLVVVGALHRIGAILEYNMEE